MCITYHSPGNSVHHVRFLYVLLNVMCFGLIVGRIQFNRLFTKQFPHFFARFLFGKIKFDNVTTLFRVKPQCRRRYASRFSDIILNCVLYADLAINIVNSIAALEEFQKSLALLLLEYGLLKFTISFLGDGRKYLHVFKNLSNCKCIKWSILLRDVITGDVFFISFSRSIFDPPPLKKLPRKLAENYRDDFCLKIVVDKIIKNSLKS